MAAIPFRIRIATSMKDVERAKWDACANPPAEKIAPASVLSPVSETGAEQLSKLASSDRAICAEVSRADGERHNPFLCYDFLHALEASGCVSPRTGWNSAHVLLEDAAGALRGAVPAYLKTHSLGEYVFDRGWADAYERAGGAYYPKLQVSVPFTPVTGRRLLTPHGTHEDDSRRAMIAGLRALRDRTEASSIHITFLPKAEWHLLGGAGFLLRTDQQFQFVNENYSSFDDFLAQLASRKRKTIRRERRDALANGISIAWITGRDITEAHWDAFFAFYMDTGSRKWGRPYLNRKFFSLVGAAMSDRILLIMAKRAGRMIAGAINFVGDDALYGRNWGAIEDHPFLHFEVCYYQAIEYAITRKLKRVEAGAQGEHKLARGYRPITTYSAHYIADPRLAKAIADYLKRERLYVEETSEIYSEHVPFRRP